MKKKIPELIPIRRIHNYVYCPRLMYFQFVENIFVYDSNVVAGEMTHKRVDKPTVTFFSEEIENNSLEKIRSLALESAAQSISPLLRGKYARRTFFVGLL